ncbi:zinc finger protein 716-like isoform X5 [Cydia strobilella]|uniref:zinc finger protein 716-like isoform X5 n=1 Tax=Cydia strobilella TaxID=1100964 RepID=UPI0030057203
MTDIAVQAMEALHNCRCCLRRPPDKGLKTMYESVGKTEVYWEMLKQCFDIRLNLGNDECGICEVCVNRLRDANDFKSQVQQSQIDLKSLLERALAEKDKKPDIVKVEILEEDPISAEPLIRQDPKKEFKAESDGDLVSNLFYTEVIASADTVLVELETDEDMPPYSCTTCLKVFERKESLTRHKFAVHAKHELQCEEEANVFDYTVPTKNIHTCYVCCQWFTLESDLITHMKIHMVLPKTFSCEVSEEKFTEESDFKKRTSVHTAILCQVCKKPFKNNSHLKFHMRCHTGERPHRCEVCRKRFKTTSHLNFHRKTHMRNRTYNFSCEMCEKKFAQECQLENHMHQHTGDKPYSCDKCKSRFARKSTLDAHVRCSHTGEGY